MQGQFGLPYRGDAGDQVIRVCYCLSHYHPVASGAERQAHLQARELVRRGHRVLVLTRTAPGLPRSELFEGVRICRTIEPREWGPGFGLTFVAGLTASLWRWRGAFDLIHCHQALWEAVAAGLARRLLGKPVVVQPAAGGAFGEVHQLRHTRGRTLLRRLILRNDRFVAISSQIAGELEALGVPQNRITRLGSGVDEETFRPGRSELEDRLPTRPRVLFLGRLHPQKNLDTLIQAWPAVRRRVAANLLIAGDGPERSRLEGRARSLGCTGSIHFLGAVTKPADYLRAADLFVLPSLAEGMSNSLLEAMSVGLPVVVSRIGGNVDLVRDGETGVLVPANVPGDWARVVGDLLTEPARARQLGAQARDFIRSNFSIRHLVDRYLELYQALLASQQDRP